MCGIFFAYSHEPSVIEELTAREPAVVRTIQRRGPDRISTVHDNGLIAIHTLLSITGQGRQPIVAGDFVVVFNGEIYNDWQRYDEKYGDTDFLTAALTAAGTDAFRELDGEFAICAFDRSRNRLYLATDAFGTKPLYYHLGPDRIVAGSYDVTVRAAGEATGGIQVAANTLIEIDVTTYSVVSETRIREFEFQRQTERSFDGWVGAFQDAILKRTARTTQRAFVSFSSGHDSGLIAAEMAVRDIPFTAYCVPTGENEEVLNDRVARLRRAGVRCDILDLDAADYVKMKDFLETTLESYVLVDPDSADQTFADPDIRRIPGYVAAAIICQRARADGALIGLSGQGADEIISDYFNPHSNSRKSNLRGAWESVTGPWTNFYGGWNRLFLGGMERIAGHFGIETRYPFLDHAVVQAYLHVHPDLKRLEYKAPIAHRLRELDFPFHAHKYGFKGFTELVPVASAVAVTAAHAE